MNALQPGTVARVLESWGRIAGIASMRPGLSVRVDPDSRLGPRRGLAILLLNESRVVVVPDDDIARQVRDAFLSIEIEALLDPEVVLPLIPPVKRVVGPATLAFADSSTLRSEVPVDVGELDRDATLITAFLASSASADLSESGLEDAQGPFFALISDDVVLAAAAYEIWDETLAHIGVVTRASDRGRGLGKRVGLAAAQHALRNHLVPQWRARPPDSRSVARSIGFVELGGQLSFELDEA